MGKHEADGDSADDHHRVSALGFLGIKAVEYHEHWEHHEFPGPNFHFETGDPAHPATDPVHTEIYFSFYWAMTGLHALHMIIGIGLVTWMIIAGLVALTAAPITLRWKMSVCTGTLSIWCGFIYFRCFI